MVAKSCHILSLKRVFVSLVSIVMGMDRKALAFQEEEFGKWHRRFHKSIISGGVKWGKFLVV